VPEGFHGLLLLSELHAAEYVALMFVRLPGIVPLMIRSVPSSKSFVGSALKTFAIVVVASRDHQYQKPMSWISACLIELIAVFGTVSSISVNKTEKITAVLEALAAITETMKARGLRSR